MARLVLDSTPGTGSTFWFQVVLDKADSAAAANRGAAPGLGFDFAGLHALLVEDNLVNQMVLKGIMDSLGVDSEVAANGVEAVRSVAHDGYDFVLMDIHMPEMGGVEAAKVIRRTSTVPIIAVTADVRAEHIRECLENGMDGFVPKPVSKEGIEAELARILLRRQISV